jgi:hypothetical protein
VEKRRQLEQQAESARKQAEHERLKQKLHQEHLNNLQLPAHAQWAKMQASQQQQQQQAPPMDLRKILEQQSLEQKAVLEQMRQAELANQQSGGGGGGAGSSWSSLFRGNQPLSPPPGGAAATGQVVSLASIQAEQVKQEPQVVAKPATMSQKIQQQQQQLPSKSQSSTSMSSGGQKTSAAAASSSSGGWAAWGTSNGATTTPANSLIHQQLSGSGHAKSNSNSNSVNLSESGTSAGSGHSNNNNNNNNNNSGNVSTGFWSEVSNETSHSNKKQSNAVTSNGVKGSAGQKNQRHAAGSGNNNEQQFSSQNKHAKKINQIEETLQQKFLHNMTISEEFMKWCAEQLRDFHVECNLYHLIVLIES